eukprot:5391843-Amphidinium_carterae.2
MLLPTCAAHVLEPCMRHVEVSDSQMDLLLVLRSTAFQQSCDARSRSLALLLKEKKRFDVLSTLRRDVSSESKTDCISSTKVLRVATILDQDREWKEMSDIAGRPKMFLDSVHILALAHTLKRPAFLACGSGPLTFA